MAVTSIDTAVRWCREGGNRRAGRAAGTGSAGVRSLMYCSALPPSETELHMRMQPAQVAFAIVCQEALAVDQFGAQVQLRERRIDQVGVERMRALGHAEAGQSGIVVEMRHRIEQVAAQL